MKSFLPDRNASIAIGLFLASPFVLWTYDSWWTAPRAKQASATFEQFAAPGRSVAEIEAKAKELKANRFEVLSHVASVGSPAAVVRWNAYHLWHARYLCIVPLSQGKAVSIGCHADFM